MYEFGIQIFSVVPPKFTIRITMPNDSVLNHFSDFFAMWVLIYHHLMITPWENMQRKLKRILDEKEEVLYYPNLLGIKK